MNVYKYMGFSSDTLPQERLVIPHEHCSPLEKVVRSKKMDLEGLLRYHLHAYDDDGWTCL